MAPRIAKRRKLEHSSSEQDGESDWEGFNDADGPALEEDSADSAAESSNTSMNGADEDKLEEEMEFLSETEPDEKNPVQQIGKVLRKPTSTNETKPPRPPVATLEDGVYTAETSKSNMFRLQVDELLGQTKLVYGKKLATAENAMRTLKTIIEQIPARDSLSIHEAQQKLKAARIAVPFPAPHPPTDSMLKVEYLPPTSINVTGSYPLKIATRSEDNLSIDVVVTMPGILFQEKDYLNHRYFYKRAYYLACLAVGISTSNHHKFKLSYDELNGNQLQPVLIVESSGNGDADDFTLSKCQIRILLALPEDTFPRNKLLPTSNCVRSKTTAKKYTSIPTPFYNSTLQSDANITSYLKLIHSTASKVDGFRDACMLGRIWLKQRGFGSQIRKGGFGNFEWAVLMSILLQSNASTGMPALSPGYSSYQLFKATLQFLSRGDLTRKLYLSQATNTSALTSKHLPVVFDGLRSQNILFKMTPWSYTRLRTEARETVDMLSMSLVDSFESTFIIRTDLWKYKYDAILELPIAAFNMISTDRSWDEEFLDMLQKVYSSLMHALTNRITAISFELPKEHQWTIASQKPGLTKDRSILIGFVTNPANANRTIDQGPSAENKQEAAAFRKFWGEKAELRRFKDGSILESVVWPTSDANVSILEQVVSYVFKRHFAVDVAKQARFSNDPMSSTIRVGLVHGVSSTAPYQPIMNAFVELEKDIRDLEELPLHLRHLRAADPQLRYASLDPPVAGHPPASVVLQFEGSGRWPDDLCAIQRTKIAFLLRLSELLTKLDKEYVSRIGLENPSQPAQNQGYLDVTLSKGFSFRIRIYHDREVTLFERQLKDKALDVPSRESAAASLALYKRDYIQIPLHSQALQTLCTRFPALSPTILLIKRWFSSHLLSPHFTPELIELLVVRTFLQPHPWSTPSTASTGFLRTLSWISRWDWRHTPLMVDFSIKFNGNPSEADSSSTSGSMKVDDLDRVQTRFEAWRKIDPAMNRVVMFAATNLDEEGTTWTDGAKPEKVVAARLTALAKAATEAIRADEQQLLHRINQKASTDVEETFNTESLFTTNTMDYDIIITVNSKHTLASSKKRKTEVRFKNLELQKACHSEPASPPLPQLFAQELQEIYGDAILWFWDPESLEHIVGLWNPTTTGQRKWKVKPGWNSLPLTRAGDAREGSVDIRLNEMAIIHEVRRLGGDLIAGIEVK